MVALRFNAGKVWGNYVIALIGGLVVVVALGSLWDRAALTGGIAGLVAVAAMLFAGALKRSALREPILVLDASGITVGVPKIGTIPRADLRSAELKGIAWVTGRRLVLHYAGTAPKLGFMDKLNWGLQAKQRGELVFLSLGFLDQTDRPAGDVAAALALPATPSP
ncbi:MAG: hypothetical protein KIT16_10185 [Rhodospirillaceae bacterium]|nr:hypothetical protein [Rhodospirillaceae bacterium]